MRSAERATTAEDFSMRDRKAVFVNREDAGVQLAEMLAEFSNSGAIVFALGPGAVPVAAETSRVLSLRLSILPTSDIASPLDPERVIGAMGPDDSLVIDETQSAIGMPEDVYRATLEKARRAVMWREELLRNNLPYPDMRGRVAILVDEGMGTPYGVLAAIRFLTQKGVRKVVVAMPTATARAFEILRIKGIEVRCLNVQSGPEFSVAQAYQEYREIHEEEAAMIVRSMS